MFVPSSFAENKSPVLFVCFNTFGDNFLWDILGDLKLPDNH